MSNRFNRSMSVDCDLPHYFSPPIAPKNNKNKFIDESNHLLWWHSLNGDEQQKWLITFITSPLYGTLPSIPSGTNLSASVSSCMYLLASCLSVIAPIDPIPR